MDEELCRHETYKNIRSVHLLGLRTYPALILWGTFSHVDTLGEIKFPVLAVLILIFGLAWLLDELGFYTVNIPWLPTIVVVIAIGMIANRYAK